MLENFQRNGDKPGQNVFQYESAKCQDSPHKSWASDFPSGGEIILD